MEADLKRWLGVAWKSHRDFHFPPALLKEVDLQVQTLLIYSYLLCGLPIRIISALMLTGVWQCLMIMGHWARTSPSLPFSHPPGYFI